MQNNSIKKVQLRNVGYYANDVRTLGLEAFGKLHGEAFLVHNGPIGKLHFVDGQQSTLAAEADSPDSERLFHPQEDFLVFPVQRTRIDKPDDEYFWLGRSEENDVVIPDASVSAVHAFMKKGSGNEIYLQDMNSMNGSFVNDEPVSAQGMGDATRLQSGVRVRFGTVGLMFLKTAEFYQLIKRLLV